MSNEHEERLKQIREWLQTWLALEGYAPKDFKKDALEHVGFLLSHQATMRPTGWQSAQVAFDDPRMVKVKFETPECAEAFINGLEPADGPVIAATRMRGLCVEKVQARANFFYSKGLASTACAIRETADALESLTLDNGEIKR